MKRAEQIWGKRDKKIMFSRGEPEGKHDISCLVSFSQYLFFIISVEFFEAPSASLLRNYFIAA